MYAARRSWRSNGDVGTHCTMAIPWWWTAASAVVAVVTYVAVTPVLLVLYALMWVPRLCCRGRFGGLQPMRAVDATWLQEAGNTSNPVTITAMMVLAKSTRNDVMQLVRAA